MRQYWFEIVRRNLDHYSWVFVERRDDTQRVLVRSNRHYDTPDEVKDAIKAFLGAAATADIIEPDGSTEEEPFPLPATSFKLVPGVVPLPVEAFPVEHDEAVGRRRPKRAGTTAKLRTRTAEPVAEEASSPQPAIQQTVTAEPEPPAAPAPKRAPRRGGRRQGVT